MISIYADESYDANNDHPWHHVHGGNGRWVLKGGSQQLMKHIVTIWLKIEDACNFWWKMFCEEK
jgi:hypothetical protein